MPPTHRARHPTPVQRRVVCPLTDVGQVVLHRPLVVDVVVVWLHAVSVTMTYVSAWDLRVVSPHRGVGATPSPFFMYKTKPQITYEKAKGEEKPHYRR